MLFLSPVTEFPLNSLWISLCWLPVCAIITSHITSWKGWRHDLSCFHVQRASFACSLLTLIGSQSFPPMSAVLTSFRAIVHWIYMGPVTEFPLNSPWLPFELPLNSPWIALEFPLNCPWIPFEFPLNSLWIPFEFPLNSLWIPFEFPLNSLWIPFEFPLNSLWIPFEFPLNSPWIPLEFPLNSLWIPFEFPLNSPWIPFEFPLNSLWIPFEFPLNSLWIPFEFPLSSLWIPLEFPLNSLWVPLRWLVCARREKADVTIWVASLWNERAWRYWIVTVFSLHSPALPLLSPTLP